MKLLQKLKHFFVPHEHNEYQPHLFREKVISVFLVIILAVFSGAVLTNTSMEKTGQGAAVLPAVLFDLTNDARIENSGSKLAYSEVLAKAAQMKANDMATHGYFAHDSPDGLSPWYWFRQAGYTFFYAGENLAVNFGESQDVANAWMNSPGHRDNILNEKFTEIGIATAEGVYKGKKTTFVVQEFGRPAIFTNGTTTETSPRSEPVAEDENIKQELPQKENTSNPPIPPQKTISEVKSAVTDSNSSREVAIISDSSNFLAVQNTQPGIAPVDNSGREPVISPRSSFYDRLISNPSKGIRTVYLAISLILFVGFCFLVRTESKKRHTHHILYGMALVVIMVLLFVVYINFFSTHPIVV